MSLVTESFVTEDMGQPVLQPTIWLSGTLLLTQINFIPNMDNLIIKCGMNLLIHPQK